MSIIYAVVARARDDDVTFLCSHDTAQGNYPHVCLEILKNAKVTDSKIYSYNGEYPHHNPGTTSTSSRTGSCYSAAWPTRPSRTRPPSPSSRKSVSASGRSTKMRKSCKPTPMG